MSFRLAIFDIDGTITRHVSSWQYIHERIGIWDEQAAEYQRLFRAGRISYRRFCELDAAHWKGMRAETLERLFDAIPYHRNVRAGIRRLKALDLKLAALSTGLQFLANRVKRDLGFDYVVSNRLAVRRGVVTGGVDINISHGGKGVAAAACMKRFGVTRLETIAVGDTAGDIPLLRRACYSIAFNSAGKELSRVVDYSCRSKDFLEVVSQIEFVCRGGGRERIQRR